jgi:hypothetical protein
MNLTLKNSNHRNSNIRLSRFFTPRWNMKSYAYNVTFGKLLLPIDENELSYYRAYTDYNVKNIKRAMGRAKRYAKNNTVRYHFAIYL